MFGQTGHDFDKYWGATIWHTTPILLVAPGAAIRNTTCQLSHDTVQSSFQSALGTIRTLDDDTVFAQ